MLRLRDARRAAVAQPAEVRRGARRLACVHELPLGQQQKVVEHLEGGAARLVDDGDHRGALHRELLEQRDHLLRLEGVQPRGGLVEEEQVGAANELAADGEPLALAARDAAALGVAHDGVGRLDERELLKQAVDHLALLLERHVRRQPQPRCEHERLPDRHLRVEDVLLPNVGLSHTWQATRRRRGEPERRARCNAQCSAQ